MKAEPSGSYQRLRRQKGRDRVGRRGRDTTTFQSDSNANAWKVMEANTLLSLIQSFQVIHKCRRVTLYLRNTHVYNLFLSDSDKNQFF
jgi:hypothetical protein